MAVEEKPSGRSLVGLTIFVIGLTIYALLAAWLGDFVAPFGLVAETLYYMIMGIVWVVPAVRLVRWTLNAHNLRKED